MQKFITRFLANESGATAIEYALIAAAMATALLAGMAVLGPAIQAKFEEIGNGLP